MDPEVPDRASGFDKQTLGDWKAENGKYDIVGSGACSTPSHRRPSG